MARQYGIGGFPFPGYVNETVAAQYGTAIGGPGFLNDTAAGTIAFAIDTTTFAVTLEPVVGFLGIPFEVLNTQITVVFNEVLIAPVPVAANLIYNIVVVLTECSGDVVLNDYGGRNIPR